MRQQQLSAAAVISLLRVILSRETDIYLCSLFSTYVVVLFAAFPSFPSFPIFLYRILQNTHVPPGTCRLFCLVFVFPFLLVSSVLFLFILGFPLFFTKAFSGFCFVVFSYPVR